MFRNPRFRQSALLSVGMVVNSILGLSFYIFVARTEVLSLSSYGTLAYFIATGILLADLCDMGISTALVRFSHQEELPKVMAISLLHRIAVGIIFLLLALIFKQFAPSFVLAVILLLQTVTSQSLLALQKYFWYVMANVVGNIFRLVLTFILFFTHLLSLQSTLVAFMAGIMLTILLGYYGLRLHGFQPVFRSVRATFIKVFHFGKWSGLSFSLAAVSSKVDTQFLFFLSGSVSVALYASAQKMASLFPQLLGSLDGVFGPKFAQEKEFSIYFTEYLLISFAGAALLLILIPLAPFILVLLFGEKFSPAATVFQILLGGMILFTLSAPYSSSVLFRFGKSFYHLIASVVQIVSSLTFLVLLIPPLGALGAAWAFVGSNLVNLVVRIVFHYRLARHA